MQDRRQHNRYRTDVMEINGKMVLAKSVKILDISIGGVCFQTEKSLNVGCEYTLKMEGKGRVLTVKGFVVWAILSGSLADSDGNIIPIYKAGMKFIDVSDEKINEIVNFIEDHKKAVDKQVDLYNPSGNRLFVRICIEDPEEAILNYHGSYKVKNISLGGMLIESEHLLEIESKLPMEMILNEESSIKFLGRIINCLLVKDKDIEHYDIRVEFVEMSEKDKEILVKFINLCDTIDKNPSFQ
jgi:c-di-GMP-binding flagellar brake protein YcgR